MAWFLCVAVQPGVQMDVGIGQAEAIDFSADELVCVDRALVLSSVGFIVSDDDMSSTTSTVLCHVSQGKGGKNHNTLTLPDASVGKHMNKHSGDHLGPCIGTEAPDPITSVDTTCIDSLPKCMSLGGTATNGVWIPESGMNVDGTLNVTILDDYFAQTCASGASGMPDSSHKSYRDIHGM